MKKIIKYTVRGVIISQLIPIICVIIDRDKQPLLAYEIGYALELFILLFFGFLKLIEWAFDTNIF